MSAADKRYFKQRWNVQKKFGLSVEQMYQLQDVCEICGSKNVMCLDHDHSVDRPHVRGILCRTCNAGLGFFQRQPAFITKGYRLSSNENPANLRFAGLGRCFLDFLEVNRFRFPLEVHERQAPRYGRYSP